MAESSLQAMELLAPAGGRSQLETALRFGADAVYLACDRFGMRQRAENFSLEDIPSAVRCAHDAGAQVHVTLNTLMDARDIEALPAYLEALAAANVDAFIVSDLGAFTLAQQYAPEVALHVSTQASVANAAAARRWHDMGASRVVCAREMSLDDIATLRANTPATLEIEAFVHGAMCVAVSGRCLLSAAMTGRSGNKGHCSQSCRWNYALVEEQRPGQYYPVEEDGKGTYVFNAQDLCMIDHLRELADAGVSSIKLEGRNKKAFYVATVVHAYRSVLDGAAPESVHGDLLAISHRPYGTGFYFGEPSQTLDKDGYVKECLHVATVLSCEPAGDGRWAAQAHCHNRFCEGEKLEVLSPRLPIGHIEVSDLLWLPEPEQEGVEPAPVKVEVANRSMARYRFIADAPLHKGDFLRVRLPME